MRCLGDSNGAVYASFLISMVLGRAVWGVERILLAFIDVNPFTASMFIAGVFLDSVPGIIVQLVLILMLLLALKRAKLVPLKD